MKTPIFTGAGVAIITPMNSDFSINYAALGQLIDSQIAGGTDAIVICGTTGESAAMSTQEHTRAVAFAVEHTAGRVPVVAGAGSNNTACAKQLSKEAKAAGANALLHVTPYYNKTSQAGLVRHFSEIADTTDLPVILYSFTHWADQRRSFGSNASRRPSPMRFKERTVSMIARPGKIVI